MGIYMANKSETTLASTAWQGPATSVYFTP